MDFDQVFIDERERGETNLRQCQLVMLRMLKILDYLCTKYEIKYFLVGGSLLGAIRHGGFIPWDDDLDIGMTRENYEKFVKIAVPELPNDVFFQNKRTDYYYPVCDFVDARLRDKYSSYIHYQDRNNQWHEGLQIDIFVFDRSFLPFNFFIILQNFLLRLTRSDNYRTSILKRIARYFPLPLVYSNNYLQSFGMLKLGSNYIKQKELSCLIRTKFEDIEVLIPVGWHSCLKRQFGNYMQLPPLGKRISHHNVIPDPFKPCRHTEILYWKDRNL